MIFTSPNANLKAATPSVFGACYEIIPIWFQEVLDGWEKSASSQKCENSQRAFVINNAGNATTAAADDMEISDAVQRRCVWWITGTVPCFAPTLWSTVVTSSTNDIHWRILSWVQLQFQKALHDFQCFFHVQTVKVKRVRIVFHMLEVAGPRKEERVNTTRQRIRRFSCIEVGSSVMKFLLHLDFLRRE